MSQQSRHSSPNRGLGRVLLYYVFLGVATALLHRFPEFRDVVSGARLAELADIDLFNPSAPAVGTAVATSTWARAVTAAMSMAGALAIMVPVTWVYMVTRRHQGYAESVVHTLLILPVAVTGIVMVVQANLALAFSLAGIVAAVRFRTTLDDTKDAVYVFLAIGVGVSSGVQALGIALVLSVLFNLVIVVLWKTQFGTVTGPTSAAGALKVGDPAILDAAASVDLTEIADHAVRIERHLHADREKGKEKRSNVLVMAYGPGAEQAQEYVDKVLEELGVHFKLIEVNPVEGRGVLLEYLAKLEGSGTEGAVMDRLNSAPGEVITAAEIRSLKGLRKFS